MTDEWGRIVYEGETSTARMRRSFAELVEWLLRDNPVPPGSVLLTGTGLVPPDDFTLQPGHFVEIHVPEIGTLVNPVVRASELMREGAHLMTDTMTGAPARNYVGGEWRESAAGETYEKRNPWRPSQVTGVYPGVGRRRRARGDRRRARGVPCVVVAARAGSAPRTSRRPLRRSRRAPSRSRRT